jgi:hypothetical protein
MVMRIEVIMVMIMVMIVIMVMFVIMIMAVMEVMDVRALQMLMAAVRFQKGISGSFIGASAMVTHGFLVCSLKITKCVHPSMFRLKLPSVPFL